MSKRNKKNISYIFTQRPVKTSFSGAPSATNVSLIITLKYCLSKFGSHGCGLYAFAIFWICLIPTKSIMVCLWPPDRKFHTVSGERITFHTRHIAYHFLLYPVLGNRPFSWWRHFATTTRILHGFAFLRKLRLLSFKPRRDYYIWIWKDKLKGFWL